MIAFSDRPQPGAPPGEYIREELLKRGWGQEDLAQMLGRTKSRVNQIITGKQELSPELAIALETVFGVPAATWLQREAEYRLSLATADTADVRRRARLYDLAPIRELQKRGWLRPGDSIEAIEQDVLKLYEIASLDEEPPIVGAMRKSQPNLVLTPSQKAWVARVRQIATAYRIVPYSESRMESLKRDLRKLAAYSAEVRKVPALLSKYGIRFVIVEPLAGGKVDGVATWLDANTPVIGMSLRFDRLDYFWFTLGHELSHIEHRDPAPVDGDVNAVEGQSEDKSPIEQRADEESAALLVPSVELMSFILRVKPLYSKERVNQFANRIKIHPGIIVGQLQHRGEVGFHALRETLVKVRQSVVSVAVTDGWGQTIQPEVFR